MNRKDDSELNGWAEPVPGELGRRTFMGATGIGFLVALGVLAPGDPAFASISWGHPFASRITPSRGWGDWYDEYYPNPGPHRGIDYGHANGTPVYSVASGTILFAGWDGSASWSWAGNHVRILHADGYRSVYAHMSSVSVSTGANVSVHTRVGAVGNTGGNWGYHLHLEIWNGPDRYADHIDPYPLIHAAPLVGQPVTEGTDMWIVIKSPGRDYALVAPGYYKAISATHWGSGAFTNMTKLVSLNDAGYDIVKAACLQGTGV